MRLWWAAISRWRSAGDKPPTAIAAKCTRRCGCSAVTDRKDDTFAVLRALDPANDEAVRAARRHCGGRPRVSGWTNFCSLFQGIWGTSRTCLRR